MARLTRMGSRSSMAAHDHNSLSSDHCLSLNRVTSLARRWPKTWIGVADCYWAAEEHGS